MNDRDQRRYDRALRVATFGQENAADFASGGKAAAAFGELNEIIADLGEAKAGQTPVRASKQTLLDALNEDFANISRTAQAVALEEPGFSSAYLVPANTAENARLTHADALLGRLEDDADDTPAQKTDKAALRARFVAYELPADFVEDLRADLDALRAAGAQNRGENQEGVENTAVIGLLIGRASDAVQRLDAVMHNKYARHPEKIRAWQSASRVERAPRRKREEPVATATPPVHAVTSMA